MNRLFLPLLFFFSLTIQGQSLTFNQLTVKDGLSQNSVLTIKQDGEDFMWFGTQYGLNRYDGSRFKVYTFDQKDSNSLAGNYVRCLFTDRNKNLWVGTSDGLQRYEPNHDYFINVKLPISHKISITNIYQNRKGYLFIGTYRGLYIIEMQSGRVLDATQLGLNPAWMDIEILCVYEDSKDNTWIATGNRLIKCRFDGYFTQIKSFVHIEGKSETISNSSINRILEDKRGRLWFATESKGLHLLEADGESFKHFFHRETDPNSLAHNAIRDMILDRENRILIGTQEGLSILDPETETFRNIKQMPMVPGRLSHNSIYSLYQDKIGSIWIGTYYGGINVSYAYQTDFHQWRNTTEQTQLNHDVISSVAGDKAGDLWIGTEGGGINHYNREKKIFSYFHIKGNQTDGLGSNFIKTVYVDRDQNIWVGTTGAGLNLLERRTGKTKKFLIPKNRYQVNRLEVKSIMEDSQGRMWVGGGIFGVFRRNDTTLTEHILSRRLKTITKSGYILQIHEDKRRHIWLLSENNIYVVSPDLSKVVTLSYRYTDKRSTVFNCMREDYQGNIWIGLYHKGLLKYDFEKRKVTALYSMDNGLIDNNITTILEDNQHHLWLATSNGLSKFDQKAGTFQNYTEADGLSSNSFSQNSGYKDVNGRLYFGSLKGLIYFDPNQIKQNMNMSKLMFTGLSLSNGKVKIGAENGVLEKSIYSSNKITLPYAENTFTVEFALLNFIKPEKNRYIYKLEGTNSRWINTNQPFATFNNLSAGKYFLQVRGANNDSVLSKPSVLVIEILPPVWKSWWAYLIYLVIIGSVILVIIRFFYLRGLLRREENLHQLKLNFFTNISHEIRSHLTLIVTPIENLVTLSAGQEQFSKSLINIKKNADRLLRLVGELMDFRRAEAQTLMLHPSENNLINFLKDIYNSFLEICERKNIRLSFQSDVETSLVYFDPGQLEKVFFNLLSNACKFTPTGESICLVVSHHSDRVEISVIDTGNGIDQQYLDKLFDNYFQVDDKVQNTGYGIGLALSKLIVELHHGEITVKSEPIDGTSLKETCFKVLLPLKKIPSITGVDHVQEEDTVAVIEGHMGEQTYETLNPTTKKFSILVVEDQEELRALILDFLSADYILYTCTNGVEALQYAVNEIPDLIISDVTMPVMDGYALCRKIKENESTSHIPVILLTARSTHSDHLQGLDTGADLYLTKPFSVNILQLSIRNLLSSRERMSRKFMHDFLISPKNTQVENREEQYISKLIAAIESGIELREFGVEWLCEKMCTSQSVLYRKVKALTGMTITEFSKTIRLKKAAILLENKHPVSEVSYMVGFLDNKYFSKEFKKQFKKKPSEYSSSKTDDY